MENHMDDLQRIIDRLENGPSAENEPSKARVRVTIENLAYPEDVVGVQEGSGFLGVIGQEDGYMFMGVGEINQIRMLIALIRGTMARTKNPLKLLLLKAALLSYIKECEPENESDC